MTVGESGQPLATLPKPDLQTLERTWTDALATVSGANQQLDLSRGKPGVEQLRLSDALETTIAGNYISADGTDTRNYGGLMGIAEARDLGAEEQAGAGRPLRRGGEARAGRRSLAGRPDRGEFGQPDPTGESGGAWDGPDGDKAVRSRH